MAKHNEKTGEFDDIDIRILKCLKENARASASAISEEIGLSVSAVIERIKKLDGMGFIRKYTIDVDEKKLGLSMVALMEVSLRHPDYYDGFISVIRDTDCITACYYQTGEFDFVLKIVTDTTEGLDNAYKIVKGYEGVEKTETHIVLRTIKEEVGIIPDRPIVK